MSIELTSGGGGKTDPQCVKSREGIRSEWMENSHANTKRRKFTQNKSEQRWHFACASVLLNCHQYDPLTHFKSDNASNWKGLMSQEIFSSYIIEKEAAKSLISCTIHPLVILYCLFSHPLLFFSFVNSLSPLIVTYNMTCISPKSKYRLKKTQCQFNK